MVVANYQELDIKLRQGFIRVRFAFRRTIKLMKEKSVKQRLPAPIGPAGTKSLKKKNHIYQRRKYKLEIIVLNFCALP